MISTVKEVEYYYSLVADKPGEARKLLEFLSEKNVNLQAFTVFPVGDGRSHLDLFPTDPELLKAAAEDAGIPIIGPRKAFLIQGEDHVGALYDCHLKLSNAGINVHASSGVIEGTGRFGYVVWVNPEDYEKAAEALKSSDRRTIQTSPRK